MSQPAPDFRLYLDLATKAADRTRGAVYFLVLALIATFALLRSTISPDWMGSRVKKLEQAYDCWCQADPSRGPGFGTRPTPAECQVAVAYAEGHRLSRHHPSRRGRDGYRSPPLSGSRNRPGRCGRIHSSLSALVAGQSQSVWPD